MQGLPARGSFWEARGVAGKAGENAIAWQAIPSYSPQAPDPKRVEYLNSSISGWEESYGEYTVDLVSPPLM